jgi:hypothetical protein
MLMMMWHLIMKIVALGEPVAVVLVSPKKPIQMTIPAVAATFLLTLRVLSSRNHPKATLN